MKTKINIINLLLIIPIAFLALGLLWPMAGLGEFALLELNDFAITGRQIRSCINTLVIGIAVAFVATLLGFFVSYAMIICRIPGERVMRSIYAAPLFAPSIMPAIGLIYLFGNNGLILNLELYGALGIFLGGLVFALPHAIIQISINLDTFDPRLLDAAKSLKAGVWKRVKTIVLPHLKNGLINSFLVTFILTITDFGVPKLLGGGFPMLATEIYGLAIESQNFGASTILCLYLTVPALLVYLLSFRFRAKTVATSNSSYRVTESRMTRLLFGVVAWSVIGYELMTILAVVAGSFIVFWPYVPDFTLANYSAENSAYGLTPWVNSLILALSVACLGTFFAFLGAYLNVRIDETDGFLKRTYETLCSIPLCIPGTVLGLGFSLTLSGYALFTGVVGSFALMIFNTVVHLYSVAHLTAVNTLSLIDRRYEVVSQSLGVSRMKTLSRVILPLSGGGIREVFSYLFSSAITTISGVIFIYSSETILASIAAIDLIGTGYISQGAALCTMIFVSALLMRVFVMNTKWKF